MRVAFPSSSGESLPPFREMYTGEQIAYFKELAFGCDPDMLEMGTCERDFVIKWRGPIRVGVAGQPSSTDLREVDNVISELHVLIRPVEIVRDDLDPNVTIHMVPSEEFKDIRATFSERTDTGSLRLGRSGYAIAAELLVDANDTGLLRRHRIRRTLAYTLGLPAKSWMYPDSIFYYEFSTTEFASIDKAVIRLLYDPRIKPGMNSEELQRIGL